MKSALRRAAAPARPLTRREKQAIDYVAACGCELNAFSVSFAVTRAKVTALIYYNRSEMQMAAKGMVDPSTTKPIDGAAQDGAAHSRTDPAQPPSPPSPAQKQAPMTEAPKQAPVAKNRTSSRPSRKSAKVDRNALSARSTASNLLSKAALAAQARVDAAKEQPPKKRQRHMPAHEPAQEPSAPAHESPSPPCAAGSSRALDDVTDAEMRDLVTVADRNSFLTPVTSEEAVIFLRAIMALELFAENGEIVGCNILNGTIYSTAEGASSEPLPPGARAAFMLAYGDKLKDEDTQLGWQTVPPRKGQRRSHDQRVQLSREIPATR